MPRVVTSTRGIFRCAGVFDVEALQADYGLQRTIWTLVMNYFLMQALNNQWANHRLHNACKILSREEYAAPRSGFFPSIRHTLCHILDVDLYYLAALQGDLPGQDINVPPDLEFETLQQRQARLDLQLADFCRALSDTDLLRKVTLRRAEGEVRERIDRLLLHLFEHQIHHRGQVHCMLSGSSVAPPQLDEFFLQADARFREDEMRALGLSERGW